MDKQPTVPINTLDAQKNRARHDLTNHPPTTVDVEAALDEATRRFIELAEWLIDNVPYGREQAVALTKLEECSMWTKAGIARNQSVQ